MKKQNHNMDPLVPTNESGHTTEKGTGDDVSKNWRLVNLTSNGVPSERGLSLQEELLRLTLPGRTLRRIDFKGALKGYRMDSVTMFNVKRAFRASQGKRSKPKYWIDRTMRALSKTGYLKTKNGAVRMTLKGKKWLTTAQKCPHATGIYPS